VDEKLWFYVFATSVCSCPDERRMIADVEKQLREGGLNALLCNRNSVRCLSLPGNVLISRSDFEKAMEPEFVLLGMSQHSRNTVGGDDTLEGKLQDMVQDRERGEGGRLHHYANTYPTPKKLDPCMVSLRGAVVCRRRGPDDYVVSPTTSERARPQSRPPLPSDPLPLPPDIDVYMTIRQVDDSNADVVGRFVGDLNRFYGRGEKMEEAVGEVMRQVVAELGEDEEVEEEEEEEDEEGGEDEEGEEEDDEDDED